MAKRKRQRALFNEFGDIFGVKGANYSRNERRAQIEYANERKPGLLDKMTKKRRTKKKFGLL